MEEPSISVERAGTRIISVEVEELAQAAMLGALGAGSYILPLAAFHPWVAGSIVAVYLANGLFSVADYAEKKYAPVDLSMMQDYATPKQDEVAQKCVPPAERHRAKGWQNGSDAETIPLDLHASKITKDPSLKMTHPRRSITDAADWASTGVGPADGSWGPQERLGFITPCPEG